MEQLDRRTEFADFLRTRRMRLSHPQGRRAAGSRRRTPGLRREEVAELAGISTAWYTWLEQGREVNPSSQVLKAIARALRLDEHERTYLLQLSQPGPAMPATSGQVPELQARILSGYQWPALILNARWDLLAWNPAARELFHDPSRASPTHRNLLEYMFLDPYVRALFVDWPTHARIALAQFRASIAAVRYDSHMANLVHLLRARSREFNAWWTEHEIKPLLANKRELHHPKAGRLLLGRAAFESHDVPMSRLLLYAPTGRGKQRSGQLSA